MDEEHSRRGLVVAGVAGGLVLVSTLLMMSYDATAGAVLPGFYVPNLTQFLIPGMLLAILATSVARKDWGTFRIRTADVFVMGFILVAILGIAMEPGYQNWKTFGNQVLFAIMFYFATRWLRLDRAKLRLVLRWVLGAAGVMLIDLLLVQLLRVGRLWDGAGPLGTLSDQAAYSALFPPLFIYMAATAEEDGTSRWRTVWLGLALVGVMAVVGVKERSGVVAVLLAVLVCMAHPRMFRYVAIGTMILIPVGAWWLSTSVGSHVRSRFTDDEDPMLRRRIYVDKAIDYINSDRWNPVLGTGFWRLKRLSNDMLSTTEVVWDPNQRRWRTTWELGQRPIHCAPVTIFGEYGYAGVFCLVGLVASVLVSVVFTAHRAYRCGAVLDSVFLVALGGSAAGLLVNALFHNTAEVFPVTALFWTAIGLLIGHADVFVVPAERCNAPTAADSGRQPRAQF